MPASLRTLFNPATPFGVEDHINIPADERFTAEIFDLAPAFVRPIQSRSPIILGRKGAGKTTVLAGYQGGRALGRRSDELSSLETGDIVIPILWWGHFQEMVMEVYNNTFKATLLETFPQEAPALYDMIAPELIEQNWGLAIWEQILKHFWSASQDNDKVFNSRAGMVAREALNKYYNPTYLDVKIGVREQARRMFRHATGAILELLKHTESSCFVLFDNMDKYPVRNPYFVNVIAGFLKCLNNFSYSNPGIHIVYCLPEELEAWLRKESTNILKDFTAAYRIRWSPIDLLCMAAHRYKIFLRLENDHVFAKELDKFDLRDSDGSANRKGVISFFDRILPTYFRNRNGVEERALLYIIRHTQLVPRHLLYLLNKIAAESNTITGGWRKFEGSAIEKTVSMVERDIAAQILHPYQFLYPGFLSGVGKVLRDLPPIFTFKELDNLGVRFNLAGELQDRDEAYSLLYKIGIFGKLIDKSRAEFRDHSVGKKKLSVGRTTYAYATFHYCEDVEKSFNTDGVFCFHPVFSSFYDVRSRHSADRFFIYPDRVDEFVDTEI